MYDTCALADRPLEAQVADGVSTIQSTTKAVAATAQNRAPGDRCAVPA
ncbi:MAG: hypothetical protein ABI321_06360 [Polyangia bacterium]